MKHYIDRLREMPLNLLVQKIAQQRSDIEIFQRDLLTMLMVLAEHEQRLKNVYEEMSQ